jgi:hypothetical protein
MDKWQYRFVIAEKHGKGIFGFAQPRDISWKVHYVNGKQQQNWGDLTLYNYLEKMGEAGWEVVNMESHMAVRTGTLPIEHLYILLKRPQTLEVAA